MTVSVAIGFRVPVADKHRRQMLEVAESLSNVKGSVEVLDDPDPAKLTVRFSFRDALQNQVVDRIGRRFCELEDYSDCAIGFTRHRG